MTGKGIAIVTGGAGFIGSNAVDILVDKGYSVRVIDNLSGGREQNLAKQRGNPGVTLDTRSILDIPANDPIFRGAEFLIHYAGIGDIVPSIDQPHAYMNTNVMGTVCMLEGARAAGLKKFVYAASSSCYGLTEELPTTEHAAISPMYPYALSKYQGEQAVFHWHEVYKLPVNSVRIFNAYGPRSRTSGAYGAVFGVFLKQKIAGKPFTVVGDGKQTRDFVFVTDVAKAFIAAAESTVSGEIFNVGAGKPQSVNHLVELLGGGEIIHLPKRPGEPDCTFADISKITKLLKWRPEVSFENGVKFMLAQIDYWKEAPLWDEQSIKQATTGWFKAFGAS